MQDASAYDPSRTGRSLMPKRVQMRRDRPWRQDHPDAVIVARPTKWGNPFRIGEPGYPTAAAATERFRAAVMGCFGRPPDAHPLSYIGQIIARAPVELRGRDLACWCRVCDAHCDGKPAGVACSDCSPCHADVLLEIANRPLAAARGKEG